MDRTNASNNATTEQMSQDQATFNELQRYEQNWPAKQAANTQAATQRAAQAKVNDAETRRRQNWKQPTSNGGKRGR